ncbi:hypothetical protein PR048_032725 [Dryococelus australis]|uniref:Uncharacterized protein n=1 Tax=Dryococelus australis TaxID=614101 RepID=A0ABQ9G751_9NEOP|nr:hypothetical protein PR048_032725 [Dryococelus australis]
MNNLNCRRNDNFLVTVAKKATCGIAIVRPRNSKPKGKRRLSVFCIYGLNSVFLHYGLPFPNFTADLESVKPRRIPLPRQRGRVGRADRLLAPNKANGVRLQDFREWESYRAMMRVFARQFPVSRALEFPALLHSRLISPSIGSRDLVVERRSDLSILSTQPISSVHSSSAGPCVQNLWARGCWMKNFAACLIWSPPVVGGIEPVSREWTVLNEEREYPPPQPFTNQSYPRDSKKDTGSSRHTSIQSLALRGDEALDTRGRVVHHGLKPYTKDEVELHLLPMCPTLTDPDHTQLSKSHGTQDHKAVFTIERRVEHQPIRALTLAKSVWNTARATDIGIDACRRRRRIRRITFAYFIINKLAKSQASLQDNRWQHGRCRRRLASEHRSIVKTRITLVAGRRSIVKTAYRSLNRDGLYQGVRSSDGSFANESFETNDSLSRATRQLLSFRESNHSRMMRTTTARRFAPLTNWFDISRVRSRSLSLSLSLVSLPSVGAADPRHRGRLAATIEEREKTLLLDILSLKVTPALEEQVPDLRPTPLAPSTRSLPLSHTLSRVEHAAPECQGRGKSGDPLENPVGTIPPTPHMRESGSDSTREPNPVRLDGRSVPVESTHYLYMEDVSVSKCACFLGVVPFSPALVFRPHSILGNHFLNVEKQLAGTQTVLELGPKISLAAHNHSPFPNVELLFSRIPLGVIHMFPGAAVAERLDCSPPTMKNRVQSPVRSLRIFVSGNRAGRYRHVLKRPTSRRGRPRRQKGTEKPLTEGGQETIYSRPLGCCHGHKSGVFLETPVRTAINTALEFASTGCYDQVAECVWSYSPFSSNCDSEQFEAHGASDAASGRAELEPECMNQCTVVRRFQKPWQLEMCRREQVAVDTVACIAGILSGTRQHPVRILDGTFPETRPTRNARHAYLVNMGPTAPDPFDSTVIGRNTETYFRLASLRRGVGPSSILVVTPSFLPRRCVHSVCEESMSALAFSAALTQLVLNWRTEEQPAPRRRRGRGRKEPGDRKSTGKWVSPTTSLRRSTSPGDSRDEVVSATPGSLPPVCTYIKAAHAELTFSERPSYDVTPPVACSEFFFPSAKNVGLEDANRTTAYPAEGTWLVTEELESAAFCCLRVRFIASRSRLWKCILDSSTVRVQCGSCENSVSRIGNWKLRMK